MTHAHPMTDPQEVKTFCLAGRARITLVSKKTGARYTYKISKPDNADKPLWFVNLLSGPDNESDFVYLGMINAQLTFFLTKKSRMKDDSTPVKAFKFFWERLMVDHIPENLEVWHEGACGRCGRPLTVPESIARGIGPDCAEMMGIP